MRTPWKCAAPEARADREVRLALEAEQAADVYFAGYRHLDGRELDIAKSAYTIGYLHGALEHEPTNGRGHNPW